MRGCAPPPASRARPCKPPVNTRASPLPPSLHPAHARPPAAVILRLVEDPNHSFAAGDTAQAIVAGVSFRFSEIKGLLHECSVSPPAARLLRAPLRSETPDLCPLAVNYRSHSGLLRVAAAIVSVMYELYPRSVDALSPDRGVFAGPLPTLLLSPDWDELLARMQVPRRGGGKSGGDAAAIALGAHQAILVRDDATRAALRATPAFAAAADRIFTTEEAKGREWMDVCLVNFFEGSARVLADDAKCWRSLVSILDSGAAARRGRDVGGAGVAFGEAERLEVANDAALRAAPLTFFDDWAATQRAAGGRFEAEVKTLYVALTRARSRLWLWEGPIPARAPAPALPYLGAASAPFAFLQRCFLVSAVHAKASADAVAPFVRDDEPR